MNRTPVPIFTPKQIAKKERAAKRKALKDAAPAEQVEIDLVEVVEVAAAEFEAKDEAGQELKEAKAKTHAMQRKALRVICGVMPKKARGAVRGRK